MGSDVDETEALTLLGLGPGASEDEIRAAYREKARYRHPDNHPGRDEGPYAELMQRLTDARDLALAGARTPTGEPTPPAAPPSPPSSTSTWRGVGRWIGFWRSKD